MISLHPSNFVVIGPVAIELLRFHEITMAVNRRLLFQNMWFMTRQAVQAYICDFVRQTSGAELGHIYEI